MSEPVQRSRFSSTPEPPYFAVIFTSQRRDGDDGYEDMARRMFELALTQPGCFGAESARDASGFGLTVAYFATEAAIAQWRDHAEHRVAQELGRTKWYEHFELRVARVERAYCGPEGR
jgi:heme-degrading monooxygenase HmoA